MTGQTYPRSTACSISTNSTSPHRSNWNAATLRITRERPKRTRPEIDPREQEIETYPAAGQIRPQTQTDLERVAFLLEVVVPHQGAVLVQRLVEAFGVEHRVDVSVVEVVRRLVPPASHLFECFTGCSLDSKLHSDVYGIYEEEKALVRKRAARHGPSSAGISAQERTHKHHN